MTEQGNRRTDEQGTAECRSARTWEPQIGLDFFCVPFARFSG